MLVLTRQIDEQIVVRDSESGEYLLVIDVVRIGPHGVRLGFTAPERIKVIRGELEERWGIVDEPQAAVAGEQGLGAGD